MKKVLILIVVAAFAGFGLYLMQIQRSSSPPVPKPPRPKAPVTVDIYQVEVGAYDAEVRPVKATVEPNGSVIEATFRHLLEQESKRDVSNAIPRGTRLLGIDVVDGIVTVDLSREFRDNFQGGSMSELLTVEVILRTLGQFPEVSAVRLLVEGKPIDTLGHLDLSVPLDVNEVGAEYGGGN